MSQTDSERIAALEAENRALREQASPPPRTLTEAESRINRGLEEAIAATGGGDHESAVAMRRRRRNQKGGDDE